jgi:hypothetical protein
MEKEFIPYEQALELKELGFDETCIMAYYHLLSEDKKDKLFMRYNDNKTNSDNAISAPLYQQCFRWFRKKYKLDFYIRNSESGCGFGGVTTHKSNFFFLYISNGYWKFNSYEEAELECLKKLIEIIKSK